MNSWLWSYLKDHRFRLLLGLFLSLVVSALNLVNPLLSGLLVDRVITGGELNLLWILLLFMIGAIVLKSVIRYMYQMIFEYVSQTIIRSMREGLFARIQRQDFAWFDKNRTGDLMAHLTGDIETVRHFIAWVIYQVFENVVIFTFSIVALFIISWQFTLILLGVAPLLLWAAWRLSVEVKPTFEAIRAQFSRLNSVVQENIAGHRVVKALVREEYELGKFMKENDAYRQRNIDSADIWGKYIPLIEFFSTLLPAVLILAGGVLVINGQLSLGGLVVFISFVIVISNPLRMMGWLMNDVQRFRASWERLFALSQMGTALPLALDSLPQATITGGVEFRNVSFSYGDEKVLRSINFSVSAGQTIGIMGPTGSGKSTLVKLLCRFYDVDEGAVLLDGVDIRRIPLETLRRGTGIAMQDVFLFSDTIEGNIAFGTPDAPREAIAKAAQLACAEEFIRELPDGYDTIIGERGVGLSGGQRQRVALARLLLSNAAIVIFDDTSSAVDIHTESRIREALRGLQGTRTVFIIAHRISSIMHADQIFVVREGNITERGTHQQLLTAGGYYEEVYRHQTGKE